jgi:O-antigen/teichoic acid export membrane protein
MLSRYTGVASVTVYDIAYKTAMQIRGLGEVGFRALIPEISRFAANLDRQATWRIKTMNQKALRLILINGIPFFGILFVFAAFILKVWLNKDYVAELTPAFRIMLVAAFVNLLGVPAFYIHMGKGNIRYCFISTIFQSLVNVVIVTICVIFAPNKIASNIFYSIALGMLVSTVYLNWQIYRDNRNVSS